MKRTLWAVCLALMATAVQAEIEIGQTYRIVSAKYPSKSLLVANSSREAGTALVLWTETYVPSQQWTARRAGSAAIGLQNVYTGGYATPRSQAQGGKLQQGANLSSARVKFEAVDEEQGLYHITPNNGSFYLTVSTGQDGEEPVWGAKSETDDGQVWKLVEVEPITSFTPSMRDEMMDSYVSRFTTSKGSGYTAFGNGGWGEAEQLEVALDAYESTGKEAYLTLATQVYNQFYRYVGEDWCRLVYNEYHWYGHDFNDDVMWMIIAVARMGWLTGETKYTEVARKNWDKIYERAYIPFTGLIRWAQNTGDAYGTNSCSTGPTEVAACYLGMAGAGEEYFEKARDLYAAQRYSLANISTGQVYDGVTWNPETQKIVSTSTWASTYNQGTMLGAACLLYDHYGTQQYLDDAKRIMDYTAKNLCDSYGLVKVCQVNDGDLCGFKGILMRYVRRFILDLDQPSYQTWMEKNALLAYTNRTDKGVTSSAWLTKSTTATANNGFSCSTAACVAVNTPLWDVDKNAYDTLQAERFDYHGSLVSTSSAGMGGDAVVYVKNGAWAQYDNVDFGSTPARSILLDVSRISSASATAGIEIYLDKLEGEPVGKVSFPQFENAWERVVTNIEPTTGVHHVYLKFSYSVASRARAFRVDQFAFSTLTADEVRTGVETPVLADRTPAEYFDLAGRRLAAPPAHGTFVEHRGSRSHVVLKP